MSEQSNETKTFIVTVNDNRQKKVNGICTYWIDTDLKVLYLKDGNGEAIAVFNQWLFFEVKNQKVNNG